MNIERYNFLKDSFTDIKTKNIVKESQLEEYFQHQIQQGISKEYVGVLRDTLLSAY